MGLATAIKELAGGRNPAALGRRVFREGSLADIDGVGDVDLFQITGGEVIITMMYGVCTELITGAMTTHPMHIPVSNTTAVDIAALSASLETCIVNSIISWDGLYNDQLEETGVGIGVPFSANTLILVPGTIILRTGVVATVGAIDWIIHYIPMDEGAVLNAL